MIFAASASITSFVIGNLVEYIGIQTSIVFMLLMAFSHAIFMISWTASFNQGYVIFLMAVTFGFTNSLANTQVRSIFGAIFPNDPAAYSGAILFETIGLILGSILSVFFQTRIKIYVYIGIIFISLVSYIFLEIRRNKRELDLCANKDKKISQDKNSFDNQVTQL